MMEVKIKVMHRVLGLFLRMKTYTRKIPQNWDEIPMSDRAMYVRFQLVAAPPVYQLLCLKKMLKIPKTAFLSLDTSPNLSALLEQLAWVEVPQIAKPLIDSFNHDGKEYFLPKTLFDRSTAFEFAYADTVYREYKTDNENDEPLRLLVACLCRPKKRDENDIIITGDLRQPIQSESEIEHRAEQLKTLPVETAYIVLRYFEGVEQRAFNALAGAGIVSRNATKTEETDTATDSPWWKTYRQLAKGLNKTEEQVQQMPFWSVLTILIEEHEESERQREKLDEIQKNYK
jgi:hypothetical protein